MSENIATYFLKSLIATFFLLKENCISGNAICKLIRRSSINVIVSSWSNESTSNKSKSGIKDTSVPFPAFDPVLTFMVSAPSLQSSCIDFLLDHVLPVNVLDKKLVAAEPTPLVPIVTRSSSNDVPALTFVQAATGRKILVCIASSKILS